VDSFIDGANWIDDLLEAGHTLESIATMDVTHLQRVLRSSTRQVGPL
jgi:hypothetical protein